MVMGKPISSEVESLYEDLKAGKLTFIEAGKKYGVSDNAVRKRFKTAGYTPIKKLVHGRVACICSQCGAIVYREYNDTVSRGIQAIRKRKRKATVKKTEKKKYIFCDGICQKKFGETNLQYKAEQRAYAMQRF